jgi:TolA-binding protein
MRQMFKKILKLAIQHQNVPEMVAINGQFVPINPSEFRNQFNVKINVGLGNGSKEQQANRILGLTQLLGMGAQAGVVRPQHWAEAIRLYVEANEFKNPERFVDPEPTGMPPNPQAFMQMQKQVEQQMGQLQQQLQQLSQENESLKADVQNKQADTALKAAELQIKEQELGLKAQEGAAKLQLQARQIDQSERDSQVKNTQAIRSMESEDDDDARLARLEQVVGQIVELLTQGQPA